MNGDALGSAEEPMETSPTASPLAVVGNSKCGSQLSQVSQLPPDLDNHLDHDGEPGTNSDSSPNENSNDSSIMDQQNSQLSVLPVPNDNSNSVSVDNNHSNSNESYQDSIDSSHQKMDHVEQTKVNQVTSKPPEIDSVDVDKVVSVNDVDSEDEVDSEEDSSEDNDSEVSEEPRAEDTVSINSDSGDETSQESQVKHKNNDIVMVSNEIRSESQNGNDARESPSPEVHEIVSDNDDCVVTNEEKPETPEPNPKELLRRSSRTIKRKKYEEEDDTENGEEESDIEEVTMEDPLKQLSVKKKTIVVNDTKSLMEMATKQMKANQGHGDGKDTVVIIDTNSILSNKDTSQQGKSSGTSSTALNAQNIYQTMAARGITVSKNVTSAPSQHTPAAQPLILPSLTDDMFVVEAPSFIVPYVYEKPSLKPFREFVDKLGKELDDQKAKEEEERIEKEKLLKEQKEKELQEKRDKGELVEEEMEVETEKETEKETASATGTTPVDEVVDEDGPKKKRKDRKRRRNEEDDDSWDGESSDESDDEALSDEEKTVVIKEKDDSIEEIKDTLGDMTAEKIASAKSDNYFDCSLGKFFINIGLYLVQEYVQNDLLKQQNRKLYKEKKTGASTRATETSIASLLKNLEISKKNNAPYAFKQQKCEFCSFKTESMLALAHHLETPHMKNNVYKCNYCAFEIRSPHDILYHMEAEHNIRGRLERAPAYHQCANCPFEDNGKGKLARHLIPCAKKFKPDHNLAPPVEWEPPAKIPKITRARNNVMGYQMPFSRGTVGNSVGRPPLSLAGMNPTIGGYRARGRSPLSVPPRAAPVHGAPMMRGGVMVRHNAPNSLLMQNNYPMIPNNQSKNAVGTSKMQHQPSISITPLARPQQPAIQAQVAQQSKGTFVICEICDGYIKDLEQLRNHMQWIHKVKIHPKMIYNRPPLNCQKCQFRFFTDQGLERHLLGSHGLVTSSMQEAANKGKDAGRCPVCGRVYQWKLLNHVARDHSLTLKPAHLSYKCTVCTATFSMYKQFESHVYSAHSVVAKRVIDKTKGAAPAKSSGSDVLKPLKINDEITIIPQPPKQ